MASPKQEGIGSKLTVDTIWKGENESEPEYMDDLESFPFENTEILTEHEGYQIYRQKLERLRSLYMGQLAHLSHTLQERRRQYLLEWHHEGGTKEKASLPSETGSKHKVAYRCYRKRTGEQGLLERKQKLKRVSATLDLYSKKELREANKSHYQHLVKLHQQLRPTHTSPCGTVACTQVAMPFASKCSKHIIEDGKQQLYTHCSYHNASGAACQNPVPKYLEPLLCGGHWDQSNPTSTQSDTDDSDNGNYGN